MLGSIYNLKAVEKLYCAKLHELEFDTPCEPIVQINEDIETFPSSRQVEVCLCGDGHMETEVQFLANDLDDDFDPCSDVSFSRAKQTKLGQFNLNLYVYEGSGYGFGDQPLREAHVFLLQYDRHQHSSLQRALEVAKRVQRVREDCVFKTIFVLAANGFDYTQCDDSYWALSRHEAKLRNMCLSLLDHDTHLVSLLLSFSGIYFVQHDALSMRVSREEGIAASNSINATYVQINSMTGCGVSRAFETCLNLYINEMAEHEKKQKSTQKKPVLKRAKVFTKTALKRCVHMAKKTLTSVF